MAIKNISALIHDLVLSHKLAWLGVLFGMGFYVADALIDAFVFNEGLLLDQLLRPEHHEMWIRLSVLIIAVAFGTYAHILLRREQATAERAQTAEKFLNSVIDNLPDMVFIKDARELRFVRVNQTGEKLLGLTTRELNRGPRRETLGR
ncbi:MAG: PAS domain-containing protein [Pseudomonadota bacterium]|nr:PAS domain-containing protein [Pseudomonadota bacterium]